MRFKLTPSLLQALCYAIGLLLTKGISLITLPIVTRYMATAEFGRLEVLVTLANGGGIFLAMGLVDTLFRFAGAEKNAAEQKRVAANVFGLALISGLLLAIPCQLAAPLITHWLPGEVSELQVRMLLVSLCLTATILVPLAWLRMENRAVTFLMLSVVKAASQAFLVVMALRMGHGVTGYIGAAMVTDLMLAGYLIAHQLRTSGIRFERAPCMEYLTYGGAIVISSTAAFFLGYFDRWVLADGVGTAKMAEYALAAKFGIITMLLMEPFEMWWYPRRFSRLDTADGRLYTAAFTALGVALVTVIAALVSIAGPLLLKAMVPSSYYGAVMYIPLLAAISAMQTSGNLVNVGCYVQRTGKTAMYINLFAAMVAVIGYFTLVPAYGVGGAIMAKLAGQMSRIVAFLVIGQRVVFLPFPAARMGVLIASAIGLVHFSAIATTAVEQGVYLAFSAITMAGIVVLLKLLPLNTSHFIRETAKT